MSAVPARRQRLLRVMGVTPWSLRSGGATTVAGGPAVNDEPSAGRVASVIVLPGGASERELDLVGKALRACGPGMARSARLVVGPAGLGQVPVAATYLVFGEAQAHALGHELPAAVLAAAHIVLVDPPSEILADAAAKRRLWNGLRAVGRALARG